MSEYGIEGLTAAQNLANALTIKVITQVKASQAKKEDAVVTAVHFLESILTDENIKALTSTVVAKFSDISTEVKNLDVAEMLQLATTELAALPALMDAFKA